MEVSLKGNQASEKGDGGLIQRHAGFGEGDRRLGERLLWLCQWRVIGGWCAPLRSSHIRHLIASPLTLSARLIELDLI
jgi:hypothetical protein